MSRLGALTKLAKWLTVKGPEIANPVRRQQLDDTAYLLSGGDFNHVSAADKASLLNFLRNEGANPDWAAVSPAANPLSSKSGALRIQQLADPTEETRLFRGAAPSLKLQEPVFTTTEPRGALYYATEGPAANYMGYGALGEYSVLGAKPARLRDMYRIMLENPGLEKTLVNNANYNVWDWLYSPEFRAAVKDRGFNSALGTDPLENIDIETLVALDKDILKPISRRIVGFEGNPIGEHFKDIAPLDAEYVQFGKTRPWTRKKTGGLVQACGCDK